jgi:hypothetical protein
VTTSVRLATATPMATTVSGPSPKAAVHLAPRQAASMVVYYSHVCVVSGLSQGRVCVVCRAIASVLTRPRMSVGRTGITTHRGCHMERASRPAASSPQGTVAVGRASGYGPASCPWCIKGIATYVVCCT